MRSFDHITFLEAEIKEIINKLIEENPNINYKNKDDFNKMVFTNIYTEGSIGNNLAINSFNKKGCEEFCKNMKIIFESMKSYWFEEFKEELSDDMLSPHELLKTYIFCKAKSFYKSM